MFKKIRKSNQKAFTLIEIIVYTALASIIVTSVVVFAMNIVFGQIKVIAIQEAQQNLRFAAAKLRYSIKDAQDISSISSSTLVLDNGSDPDITFNFDSGDKKLTKQIGAGTVVDLTSDEIEVTGSFTSRSFPNHAKNVKIEITANYVNPEDTTDYLASRTIKFAVELREK